MRRTPRGDTSRHDLVRNAPTLSFSNRHKVRQSNFGMPSFGTASQAIRVPMALKIGETMQVRPDDFPIFCKAATALAEEDLRALSTEPERLTGCLLDSLLDGWRYKAQPHGLALCAVTEFSGQPARLRSEVIAIEAYVRATIAKACNDCAGSFGAASALSTAAT